MWAKTGPDLQWSKDPPDRLRHMPDIRDDHRGSGHHRIRCRAACVYVGQTCRTLDHRLKEHKRALTSGNLAQSAVAEHAANESHVIDWKGAKVVDTHPRYHQRCALESWHIRSETTTMNRDDGSLPQAYNTLLNYPRKPHTPH